MIIGGLQKFSCVDYPGKTCAILFTRGCNFRCRYCHNPELVISERYAKPIELEEVFRFLEARKGLIDGVCITGGEPTLHHDLPEILDRIKRMGFFVKLDSNGTRPDALQRVIDAKIADYIAMDIKAPPDQYRDIVGVNMSAEIIRRSIHIIINSGIDHEFRTTIVKELTTFDDLRAIAVELQGAQRYFLQRFIQSKACDASLANATSYPEKELRALASHLECYVDQCRVR